MGSYKYYYYTIMTMTAPYSHLHVQIAGILSFTDSDKHNIGQGVFSLIYMNKIKYQKFIDNNKIFVFLISNKLNAILDVFNYL